MTTREEPADWFARAARWPGAIMLVGALALLVGAVGMSDLPLDGHEVLVARTAQEMHDRGDWVVPYFNGAPRLNKPPMSYWLTGVAAWASGGIDAIQPWHARLPSVLGALGVVLLCFVVAKRLFDPATALAGAVITLSTSGYFTYAHDARPDMLYAFFCTLGIAGFVLAYQADKGAGQRAGACLMWVAFALATLTKGPQLPFTLLLAETLFLLSVDGTWRRTLGVLRPVSGVLLALVVAAPWWWWVERRLGAHALVGTQLAGSLLRLDWPPGAGLYYAYRPLQLLLPWVVLVPGTLWVCFARFRSCAPLRLFVLLCVVPAAVLSFGPQRRWFYMLPLLMPMCVLLALGARALFGARGLTARARLARCLLPLHWLVLVGFALWGLSHGFGYETGDHGAVVLAGIAAGSLLMVAAGQLVALRSAAPLADVGCISLLFVIVYLVFGVSKIGWGRDRFQRVELARTAQDSMQAGDTLLTWQVDPKVFVYYARRPVREVADMQGVLDMLRGAPGGHLYLVMRTRDLGALPRDGRARVLLSFEGEKDAFSLVKLSRGHS